MALSINKQIVITKTAAKLKFDSLAISKNHVDETLATIIFILQDAQGKIIDRYRLAYEGLDFNTFWSNFNSFNFLLQELKAKYPADFGDLTIADIFEEDILNK